MNRMTKLLTLSVAAVVVLGFSSHAYALCPVSQPAQNFSTKITNCRDNQSVAGFVGVIGSTATNNSAGLDVVCEQGGVLNAQQVVCPADSGGLGDGLVQVIFDWGNLPPANGCPNASGLPNVGRNIFQIVCNDGAGALATVAYDIGSSGYPLDFADPYDPASGDADMHLAPNQNGLKLASFNRGGGTDSACIDQVAQPVRLYSDCDPTSVAVAFGVVCPDTTPSVAPGANLFTFTGPAAQGPTDLRTTAWTTAATTAGPGGSKCVNFPTPAAAGTCTWIGSTSVVGGSDTGAISGWVQVCDPTASTDKVKINSAAFNQGKLDVSFSTENEAMIVGFNVYAGTTKLNTGLIAAKGTGSNAYSFEVGRGAVKSNKTVTVEAVKSDGTVVKTAPANVK